MVYFYLFLHVLLHEFGHVMGAKFCGSKIRGVRIGMGPKLVGRGYFHLHLVPLSGGVDLEEEPKDHPKKYIIIAASGVLTSTLVAIILNILWWYNMPKDIFVCYTVLIGFSLLYCDITNFLPLKSSEGNLSDGGVILDSLKKLKTNT